MSKLNSPEYSETEGIKIYKSNITAIHVAPDDNPVLRDCDCISFVYFSKEEDSNKKTKEIVLFGGGYEQDYLMCSLSHELLVQQAIEIGIIDENTKIEGGGVIDAHTFEYMKPSNLYGEPDREILEGFTELALNHFRKPGFQF